MLGPMEPSVPHKRFDHCGLADLPTRIPPWQGENHVCAKEFSDAIKGDPDYMASGGPAAPSPALTRHDPPASQRLLGTLVSEEMVLSGGGSEVELSLSVGQQGQPAPYFHYRQGGEVEMGNVLPPNPVEDPQVRLPAHKLGDRNAIT